MEPIFNEKVAQKWNLWVHEQCMNALFTEDLVKCYGWIKKKKAKHERKTHRNFQCSPNEHNICNVTTYPKKYGSHLGFSGETSLVKFQLDLPLEG